MKLWMRMLLGIAIGLLLGSILPVTGRDALAVMEVLARLVVNIGRYAAYPLVFFGVVIGVYQLRESRMAGRLYGVSAAAIAGVTGVTVLVGTLTTLLLSTRRIPPIYQEAVVPALPSVPALLDEALPRNLFTALTGPGDYLLPVVGLAVLVGLLLRQEGPAAMPAIDLSDSLSRVFYRLNAWFLEAVSVGLIAVSAAWLMRVRAVSDLGLFAPLLWLVASVAAFFVLVLYPLCVWLVADRYNPFAWLYGLVNPVLVAFFSGDSYFAFGALTRATKENYGVSREVAAPVLSLATVFSKAGSAMVITASFITVLRSYTALEITFLQVLWIMAGAFLLSFLLGRVPGAPVLVGLSVLAGWYGHGMDEVYLILLPALPILTGIAVVVDTATAALIAFVTATWERKRRIVDVLDFI